MLLFLENDYRVDKKLLHPHLLEKENKSYKQTAGAFGINCNYTDVQD
jgi:hypothetical protein